MKNHLTTIALLLCGMTALGQTKAVPLKEVKPKSCHIKKAYKIVIKDGYTLIYKSKNSKPIKTYSGCKIDSLREMIEL